MACLAACCLVLGMALLRNQGDVLPGPASEGVSKEPAASKLVDENGAEYRAGELLVQLPDGMSAADANSLLAGFDFVVGGPIAEEDVAFGWVKVGLAPGVDVEEAAGALQESGLVSGAQPNYVYYALGDFADSPSPVLQAAPLAAQSDSSSWHVRAVHAQDAWDALDAQGDVTVAIIDSGYDTGNATLKARVLAGSAYNVLTETSSVNDVYGHGTAVASVVASVLPSTPQSSSGAERNIKIMPVKVMDGESTDTANLVKAYAYILRNAQAFKVRVVNMSLGSARNRPAVSDMATMYAIDKAYKAGILSVFAGGNDGESAPYYCYPCDYAEDGVGVINLTRTDKTGEPTKDKLARDSSSNYNMPSEKTKSLSAPGTDVDVMVPGGKTTTTTGTSFASPIVAGVAALAFAENPSLSPGEAKSVLCTAADDLVYNTPLPKATAGFDDATGYGLVRADKAVAGARSSYIAGEGSLLVGDTVQLSTPGGGAWTWSSDAPAVATVDSATGLVEGVSGGEAIICATDGTKTLQRTIVVYEVAPRSGATAQVGLPVVLNAFSNPLAAWTYSSSDPSIASIGATSSIVTGKHVGTVTITAVHSVLDGVKVSYEVKVLKGTNPLKVKAKKLKAKASKLARKSLKFKVSKAFKVKNAEGRLTFKVVKRDRKAAKRIKVSKAGKVTVKKGLGKGSYKVKVRVSAAGNADYKPAKKTVTLKVRVS